MAAIAQRQNRRRTILRRAAPSAVVALTATALLAPSARAAGPSFSVQAVDAPTAKPYFVFDGPPGTELAARIRIVNSGTSAGSAKLYAVDATTGQTSGAVYKEARPPRRGVGRWMSVGEARVALAPGQSREVPFVVRVPRGVSPGQHLGGIVAENAKVREGKRARRDKGRFQVNVRNLSVVAVQVNAPGRKVADMAIGGVKQGGSQGGFQAILVNLSSRSNYLLKPSLAVRVENASGKEVQRFSQKLDTFVPDTAIDFPVPVRRRALGPGSYTAYITMRYAGKTVTAVRRFEISDRQLRQIFGSKAPKAEQDGGSIMRYLPWGLLALLGLGGALRALRARATKRRRGGGPSLDSAAVPSGHVPPNASIPATAHRHSNGQLPQSGPLPQNGQLAGSALPQNGLASPASTGPTPPPETPVATSGELARLISRLDEPGPRWMLGAIANGVLSGRGASAHDIRGRAGRELSQWELDRWSHRVTVVCDEIAVDRPFRQVDVATFGTVYQMEPEVAQEVRRALYENERPVQSSHPVGTTTQVG